MVGTEVRRKDEDLCPSERGQVKGGVRRFVCERRMGVGTGGGGV